MAGPGSGMARKHFEVEPAVRAADEFRPPGFEIAHHVDDVINPDACEIRIDQFPAVLEDILQMKFGAVVLAHGGGEASARYRGRAAGGAAFGHLGDRQLDHAVAHRALPARDNPFSRRLVPLSSGVPVRPP